jgi:hypothetical protein
LMKRSGLLAMAFSAAASTTGTAGWIVSVALTFMLLGPSREMGYVNVFGRNYYRMTTVT